MQVDLVDRTGAGDCLAGVFAAALDRAWRCRTRSAWANVAALCCTQQGFGAQGAMPMAGEIKAALPGSPEPADKQAEVED